jgi:dynamin 1-like protein
LQGRTYNGDVPMVLGASFRYARSTVGVSGIQLAESLVASPYIGFTVQSPTQRFMLATNIITHNSTPLFIPEIAFELLTKKQIERLLQPSLDCVDLVWNELQRVALQCELLSPELIRFPHLRTRMLQVFQTLLKSCLEPTKAHIEAVIQCELSFINTSHSDFIGGSAAVAIIMDRIHRMQAKSSSERSSSSSASSAPSDLSSKVAGVTGMVSNKHRSESSVAEADGGSKPNYLHSRTDSRAVNSTASSTTVAAPSNSTSSHGGPTINTSSSVAPSPATSGRQGFFSSFFRSPPPAAVEAQRKRYSGHQSSGERLSQETDSFASLQEHEMYMSANNAPAAASSHAHALAASSAGAPAWHIRSLEPTERELIEVEVIKILMQSYFGIVRKTVMDAVPKAIMCFLVKRIQREIQAMLVRDLYQPQLLDQLLREADDIAEKREAAAELLQILERAIAILNSARDFNALC